MLATPEGVPTFQAEDEEPAAGPERLELLAVIRGLEAIDAPSRVILLNASPRLRRALEHDLARWRADDWHWERFGAMVPIKNADLWRRLNRLLEIHTIQCGPAALQAADDLRPPPAMALTHLVVGGRRLRIDQPAKQGAPGSASLDLEGSSVARPARRITSGRPAAGRQSSAVPSMGRRRLALARRPRWKQGLRGVFAALHALGVWLRGRLATSAS